MKKFAPQKRSLLEGVGYLIFGILLFLFSHNALVIHANTAFLDTLRTKEIEHNAVVIAIDDASLQKLGAWPLDRSVFAQLIEALEGYDIEGLVFDVLFLEEKEGDVLVEQALNNVTYNVALGAKYGDTEVLHPVYPLSSNVREGFVNVVPDKDGKVRDFVLPITQHGTCLYPLSYPRLLQENTKECSSSTPATFLYPKDIPEFSLVDVIEGKVPKELLADKMLFVGATTLDLGDFFVGLEGNKIPGVYVHVGMYASHNAGLYITPVSNFFSLPAILFLVFAGWFLVVRIRKVFVQLGVVLLSLLSLTIIAVLAFETGVEVPLLSYIFSFVASILIAIAFRFAQTRKENAFIKNMFSRYVNKDVLAKLLENGAPHKEGEKRYISVLFSDLRGFTDFSETLLPEELTALLNKYFASMVAEIFKESGTVDKFIGDAVMAFWNAPLAVKDHEVRALYAAIGMQEALARFNKENNTLLKMGIGIHAGYAVIGNVGGEERMSYTALGDSVNTASRLEGITKKYGAEIIISEEIKKQIGSSLEGLPWRIRKLDEVRLKGKQQSTLLFEVTKMQEEAITLYEKAFLLYQSKAFKEALTLLDTSLLKNDTASLLLRERIVTTTFPDAWDGVFTFDEK